MINHHFTPSGCRARAIDRRMRALLADSLVYIAEQVEGILPFDGAALNTLAEGLAAGQKYPPSTFGLYTELVLAINAGDNDEAVRLLAELALEKPLDQGCRLGALKDPASDATAARYMRLMNSDPTANFNMLPPTPAIVEQFKTRFEHGYQLLRQSVPALADEFDALVSQIILVEGDSNAQYQFDGGSSYMLWGGLFLNAASHENPVAVAEVLAHESAHILLFGFASDEPLVHNDDSELYASPLRTDLRPMDGIYHATYVSARMHWAMSALLAARLLDAEGRMFAEAAQRDDKCNFAAGYGVVEQYAKLTPTGRAVMAAAKAYMDSVS